MGRGNSIRIIGGRFRGRRLGFPSATGLRPTADRLRETLFNWLQGELEGARCLDLFAGSGALGFEALSRGAAWLTAVDAAPAVARRLNENLRRLGVESQAEVVRADAFRFLARPPRTPFDLVFLDPPYAMRRLPELCRRLEEGGWLGSQAWIYIEQDAARPWPEPPVGWRLHREAQAGQAACRLLHRANMA